ncbi:MAG: hypothetical protein ACE5JD_16815 [Candidatus Methylomirabilia bacterium]
MARARSSPALATSRKASAPRPEKPRSHLVPDFGEQPVAELGPVGLAVAEHVLLGDLDLFGVHVAVQLAQGDLLLPVPEDVPDALSSVELAFLDQLADHGVQNQFPDQTVVHLQ